MGLILIGLNHSTASLPVRERVAYSREEAVTALQELKREQRVPQALLLSTCNRTEVYAVVSDPGVAMPQFKERLFYQRLHGLNGHQATLYEREDAEAVQHLFRVTCGLDSMVLGENEILGQVKAAYEISRTAETLGTVFHRLAARAFRVGKRARTETRIGLGTVSVAYAAVELAEKVFQSLEGRGALLLGAGENGTLCAEHLLSRRVEPLLIGNRTPEKAELLAGKLGGETVPFDRLRDAMTRVDIVVSTTGSPNAIVDPEMVREVMRGRGGRPLVFIDIAVPRDVDPAVDRLQSVFRFDLDALQSVVEQNVGTRRTAVPAVEKLVESEVRSFMRWWESLSTGPVIRDLNRQFESIRKSEVDKHGKRFVAEDQARLETLSRNLVRKLLMGMTKEIKHYRADDPVHLERLAALREVFHLDEDEEDDESLT